MSTSSSSALSPVPLMQLSTGFWASKTLFAAHTLDVFGLLSDRDGATPAELAKQLGIAERPAEMLLTGCASLGLLAKRDGRYVNAPLADEYLVRGRPHYFGGFRDLQDKRLYASWGRLVEAVRTNRPVGWDSDRQRSFFDTDDPAITIGFYEAMHSLSTPTAQALAGLIDFRVYHHLLDLGGGSAAFDIELCRLFPDLRATVFDLPGVVEFAAGKIADADLADRITTQAGDLFDDDAYPPGHDVALLSLILHSFTENQDREILDKCFHALPSGGTALISELLVDDDKTGPAPAALMSLTMLVEDESRNDTGAEYTGWLTDAGFTDIQRLPLDAPGAIGILLAHKP
jgi:hypothetical protein